jgi:transcriptional regulator with XRE-family HTH domain
MLIGERLRELRESKRLSQSDIEKRTGLLRCYSSRVENGHTVPSIETLEKYARALEVPLYRFSTRARDRRGSWSCRLPSGRRTGCGEQAARNGRSYAGLPRRSPVWMTPIEGFCWEWLSGWRVPLESNRRSQLNHANEGNGSRVTFSRQAVNP